jgi:hypothetical protein
MAISTRYRGNEKERQGGYRRPRRAPAEHGFAHANHNMIVRYKNSSKQ